MQAPRHVALGLALVASASCGAAPPADVPLELVRRVPLEHVTGRIDHLAFDPETKHLWVAALGNDTLELVDPEGGAANETVRELPRPTGVALDPETGLLAVASSRDGRCALLDRSRRVVAVVEGLDDADNVRLEPGKGRFWVGFGDGGLAALTREGERTGEVEVGGHPESFQLEAHGPRIFVNVPDRREVVVVDREALRVVARWPLPEGAGNFPMALDEEAGRLLVVARDPPRLLVLDAADGRRVEGVLCCGDADDVFLGPSGRRVYVSGGDGRLSVFQRDEAGRYAPRGSLDTLPGARTSLLVPETGVLYVAAPRRGERGAEVLVYRTL